MKQPTTRMVYDYWNDLRGQRTAPTRFEIEPTQLAPVLSETFILEQTEDGAFPFRLAGTRICELVGRELRGEDFTALVAEDRRVLVKAMDAVTRSGAALVAEIDAASADGRVASFEAIVLPLLHPDDVVTRYLGALTAVNPPLWLGQEPLETMWLGAHELIWPNGRPYAYCDEDERQLPFSPDLSAARIVRSDRRQFRILDGGRKD